MSAASVSPLLLDVSTDNHEIIQALWDANATRYLSGMSIAMKVAEVDLLIMLSSCWNSNINLRSRINLHG